MNNFKKFKRVNIYAKSDLIDGNIYVDMAQAEAIEFEELCPSGIDDEGKHWESKPIRVIHISTNQSSHTVLDERTLTSDDYQSERDWIRFQLD